MDFPLHDLMDQQACYQRLLQLLHPQGLACPRCGRDDALGVHRRHRDPVLDYQCGHCGRVFNAFTATPLHKTSFSCSQWLLLLRGICQGVPTARLARELGCDRGHLLGLRHRLQGLARRAADAQAPLPDEEVEADEMFHNAGEKGTPHPDPDDPPRRRANQRRGRGTYANDRPPVAGLAGRQSRRLHLEVVGNADGETLGRVAGEHTAEGATVYTDEWQSYAALAGLGYGHATVCHTPGRREWARDEDGDGVREVHVNTLEGLWTGLRNFLRPLRGVHKRYLGQYVALFWWAYRLKAVTDDLLRIMLGVTPSTPEPT